jgi:ATP dependent DNA ligase domain
VDGWRILAYKDGERVRLVSRNDVDHTRRFAAVAAAIAKLSARTLVLDGEIAIYDQQLRSRFEWLREPEPGAVATPPVFPSNLLVRQGARGQPAVRARAPAAPRTCSLTPPRPPGAPGGGRAAGVGPDG